jgi:hypothetical protein
MVMADGDGANRRRDGCEVDLVAGLGKGGRWGLGELFLKQYHDIL